MARRKLRQTSQAKRSKEAKPQQPEINIVARNPVVMNETLFGPQHRIYYRGRGKP
jgi:hypothetical protein